MNFAAANRKKPRIRPVQRADARVDEMWQILSTAIKEIYSKNAGGLSFEELYRNAYNMVLYKQGDKLYDGVVGLMTDYLQSQRVFLTEQRVLTGFVFVWEEFTTSAVMIRDILMYMDRVYVKTVQKVPIYEKGLELFRDCLLDEATVHNIVHQMLREIDQDRHHMTADMLLVKKAVHALAHLTLHSATLCEVHFEGPFLQTSQLFFEKKAAALYALDVKTALKLVQDLLIAEETRVEQFLNPKTKPRLVRVAEECLIRVPDLVRGLSLMLMNEEYALVRLLIALVKRVDQLKDVEQALHEYIVDQGNRLAEEEHFGEWTSKLLEFHDQLEHFTRECFQTKEFQVCIHMAFGVALQAQKKAAEFLSLFIDEHLKKNFRGKNEQEVDHVLDKTMLLFRFLRDKDLFERYYKQHLAKRLLNNRCVSEEYERLMISRLKHECGYQFTMKLEGMFKDMKLSQDMEAEFSFDGFQAKIHVLTSTFWPLSPQQMYRLPAEMTRLIDSFNHFYSSRHSGRKLQWMVHMGTGDLIVHFAKGTKELSLVTPSMILLLNCFSHSDTVSLEEMANGCDMPLHEVKKVVWSLSTKYKILIKKSDKVYAFHHDFVSPLKRIKIPHVSVSEKDSRDTVQSVQEDRKHMIDAALVRIMKTRKSSQHNTLVSEAMSQCSTRFEATPLLIKQRIEALIEREYIERDDKDRRLYHYIA